MAGIDLRALTDFPDRDDYVSGREGLAYRLARRLLWPTGGLADLGDPTHYESLDLRAELGRRFLPGEDRLLAQRCRACLLDDEEVQSASVTIRLEGSELVAEVDGVADEAGPFGFVLSVADVTTAKLELR